MNLKPEFISLMTKNIREHEKRLMSLNKPAKGKQSSSSSKANSKNLSSASTLDSSFKEKSFFDLLSSSSGYKEFLLLLTKKMNAFDGPQDLSSKGDKDIEIYDYDEYRVFQLFKEIFSEVYEYQILELFDLFESKITNKINSNDIFFMVAYVAAAESIQTLEYLHIYSDVIFNSLSMNQTTINCSRMKAFGKLIGVSERKLITLMKDLNIKEDQDITLEDFEMFYFAIFEDMENSIAKSTLLANSSSKKDNQKLKTCKRVCNIF